MAFATNGDAYIVEMGGHRVSMLDGAGRLRVFAGTGEPGLSGDGGPASQARFNSPHHLAFGPDGRLYVADTQNFSVRRIDLTSGMITRVAGTGVKGFGGDGGPAADAQFGGIFAIAFRGSRLYLCDLGNRRVRVVDLTSEIVTTVAGNGEKGAPVDGQPALGQPLVDPRAIAVDVNGNLYILEREGHALRVVSPDGRIRTVAGTGTPGYRAMADLPDRQSSGARSTSRSTTTIRACLSPIPRTTSSGATHPQMARSPAWLGQGRWDRGEWRGRPTSAS